MFKQKVNDAKSVLAALLFLAFVVFVFNARNDESSEQGSEVATTNIGTKETVETTPISPPQPTPEEVAAKEREILYGQNCMSPWNGSHPAFVDVVKAQLNDPRSFEHVETTSWPRNDEGRSKIVMTFRAKNGFGGTITAKAVGTINGDNCQDAKFEFMNE